MVLPSNAPMSRVRSTATGMARVVEAKLLDEQFQKITTCQNCSGGMMRASQQTPALGAAAIGCSTHAEAHGCEGHGHGMHFRRAYRMATGQRTRRERQKDVYEAVRRYRKQVHVFWQREDYVATKRCRAKDEIGKQDGVEYAMNLETIYHICAPDGK